MTCSRLLALSLAVRGLAGCDSAEPGGLSSRVSLEVQPQAPAPSGKAFGVQPVVQLLDARGLPVRQAGVVISASIASGPGAGTVEHGSAVTDPDGKAVYRALAITGPI